MPKELQTRFHSLIEIFNHSSATFADAPLFGVKRAGTWAWSSRRQFGDRVKRLHTGLVNLGIVPGDRVAVISDNSVEWAVAAYATYGCGAAYVAMYESERAEEWRHILNDCGAKVCFVADAAIANELLSTQHLLPQLQHVVVMEGEYPVGAKAFDQLEAAAPSELTDPGPEAIACFIYTSGTTGNPKGVRLSHRNLAYNVCAMNQLFPLRPDDRSLSFLPWAHSFGQTVELHGMMSMGCSMAINDAVENIVPNLAEVKPTLLASVPRIFNRIYDGVHKKMAEEGGAKEFLFHQAVAAAKKKRDGKSGVLNDLKFKVLDAVVFEKVRARFGGNLKYAISGGAAISKEVAEFIDGLGIMVYEGYGLSETSPIATMNCPSSRKLGSVGKAIPGVRIEIDRSVVSEGPDGEVVIYGHNVMQGYHGLAEENAKVLIEGGAMRGFRSGDLGRLDRDGFLFITGRVKEQYKLLNGKYVVPTPLEEQLKLSPYIVNAMVHGANREFNVGLIVPDYEALKPWAAANSVDANPASLVRSDKLRALIQSEVDRLSAPFRSFERLQKFALLPDDFTLDNGMLTPTLKLKRRAVLQAYQTNIDALYL